MKKKKLMELFDEAHKDNSMSHGTLIELLVMLPEAPSLEKIIVPAPNLSYKKDYIDKTYGDNLEHRHAEGVFIIGCNVIKPYR